MKNIIKNGIDTAKKQGGKVLSAIALMATLQSCQPPHQVHLHNQEKIIKNLKKELPSSLFDYNISFTVNGEWIGPNTRESIKDITVVKKDQTITISHEVEEGSYGGENGSGEIGPSTYRSNIVTIDLKTNTIVIDGEGDAEYAEYIIDTVISHFDGTEIDYH